MKQMNEMSARALSMEDPRYIEIYHCYIDVSVNSQRTGPASSSRE